MKRTHVIILGVILLSFAAAPVLYPQMPERMASHWDALGQADNYTSKFWGLFLIPLISLAILLLFTLLPRIDPLKKNIVQFRKHYDNFALTIIFFLLYAYLLTIIWNLGVTFNMTIAIIPAFATFFHYLGSFLAKTKRNWFLGIRTPWTLSNDEIWNKTHILGAKLFKLSAIITLIGIALPKYAIWAMLVPITISTIFLVIYSYFQYKYIV